MLARIVAKQKATLTGTESQTSVRLECCCDVVSDCHLCVRLIVGSSLVSLHVALCVALPKHDESLLLVTFFIAHAFHSSPLVAGRDAFLARTVGVGRKRRKGVSGDEDSDSDDPEDSKYKEVNFIDVNLET